MALCYDQKMQAEVDKTKADGENLIQNIFPERIRSLKALVASEDFQVGESPSSIDCEKLKEQDICEKENYEGVNVQNFLQRNSRTRRLFETLKPYYYQMIEDFRLLSLWLDYMIPKIEDGNDFGVGVLQNVLGDIYHVEGDLYSRAYLGADLTESRACLVKRVLEYPLVNDYKIALDQLDQFQIFKIQRVAEDLYQTYTFAYDIMLKNIEKVRTPRSDNSVSLY